MTPAYMPFTYLPESTARLLFALVGPVVIYQPLKKNIPESLSASAAKGLVEIRTPVSRDDDRLSAALAEFMDWARMNPGRISPGSGFSGSGQADIPFYDENAVNRIRSEIKRYHLPDRPSCESEAEFSARLFLAVAQANELARDQLGRDLDRFNSLEKNFLGVLTDADPSGFSRRFSNLANRLTDPGEKLTAQRIRAWSGLAAADPDPPEVLATTSAAAVDLLQEAGGRAIGLERLSQIRLVLPADVTRPVLSGVLAGLMGRENLSADDLAPFTALADDDNRSSGITVTLFSTNRPPVWVIRQMAPSEVAPQPETGQPQSAGRTLFVLVEG